MPVNFKLNFGSMDFFDYYLRHFQVPVSLPFCYIAQLINMTFTYEANEIFRLSLANDTLKFIPYKLDMKCRALKYHVSCL